MNVCRKSVSVLLFGYLLDKLIICIVDFFHNVIVGTIHQNGRPYIFRLQMICHVKHGHKCYGYQTYQKKTQYKKISVHSYRYCNSR